MSISRKAPENKKINPQAPVGIVKLPDDNIKVSSQSVNNSGTATPSAEIIEELQKASRKDIFPSLNDDANGQPYRSNAE